MREVHWGLVPDMTGTLFLSRLVRPDIAKELTFTARIFDGREAAAIGLATRLTDDPVAEALDLAAEIADRSPDAVHAAKRLFSRLANEGAAEQFAEERREIADLIGTPNHVEAVMASVENRPAEFRRSRSTIGTRRTIVDRVADSPLISPAALSQLFDADRPPRRARRPLATWL